MENFRKVIGKTLRQEFTPPNGFAYNRSFVITDVRRNGKSMLFVGERPYEMACFSFDNSRQLVLGKMVEASFHKAEGEVKVKIAVR